MNFRTPSALYRVTGKVSTCSHRRNLANNTGGGSTMGIRNSDASILRPVKRRSLIFCLYTTQIIVLKIFIFYLFVPVQHSSQKNYS
jgi:hypothetical protein